MSQAISLFEEVKKGGYDACLMTTFSVDFPFYEDVLLRRMQGMGINHHMLFVDKGMSLAAILDRPPCKAGSHYVLAPMDCPGAFHPKLLMLLGKNKGLVAIGSHNATLSGFGQNLEITNVLRFARGSDEQNLRVFQQAFGAFQDWLASYGSVLPHSVKESLDRTVHLSPWLNATPSADENSDYQLLYTSKRTQSLWEQLQPMLPDTISRITGISAFFDTQLAFVNALAALSTSAPVIGVQPNTVSAPAHLTEQSAIRVVDVNSVDAIRQGKSYIHAKLFHMEGDEDLFVSGSANFSKPAWLNDADTRNAEVVMVIKGEQAQDAARDLSLAELLNAPSVQKILPQEIQHASPSAHVVALVLVDDDGGESVEIPIQPHWPNDHGLAYVDEFGDNRPILAKKNAQYWSMSRDEYREGEIISVVCEEEVLARIVVLNVPQLRSNSSAGKERALQQALGSLNSDNPDLELLFRCFGQMLPEETSTKKGASSSPSFSTDSSSGEAPETLLSELGSTPARTTTSGRDRCSSGDIGLLLDMFIYNLGSAVRADSATAYGEDALGRNEEDMINSEADAEVPVNPAEFLTEEEEEARNKADKQCQRKLQALLKSAKVSCDKAGVHGEEKLRISVPIILGILVLTHELYQAQKDRKWVVPQFIDELVKVLFLEVFSEKHPINQIAEELDASSVFVSDEWAQLVGYATWLAYHADISLRQKLPVSAQMEEKDTLRWKNACWLFLAQRVAGDSVAKEIATNLLAQDGKEAESWLTLLSSAGQEIVTNQRLPLETGFHLASSPGGAYVGYRFVTDMEGDFLMLASINTIHNSNRFKLGFVDIVEPAL